MTTDSKPDAAILAAKKAYWRSNITLVLILMGIWFLFGCVLSIFAVDTLNQVRIGGFPLGFWMAQQGTTIAFIVIIFAYVLIMKRLDQRYLDACKPHGSESSPSE